MLSSKVMIERFIVVPCEITGFGWKSVREWNGYEYQHKLTVGSEAEARRFIQYLEEREVME